MHICILSSTAGYREPWPDYIAVQQKGRATDCVQEKTMTTLKTISEKVNAWRRYREAVRELSQLTDRELSDIGIRRGDIEDVVRRSVMKEAA